MLLFYCIFDHIHPCVAEYTKQAKNGDIEYNPLLCKNVLSFGNIIK